MGRKRLVSSCKVFNIICSPSSATMWYRQGAIMDVKKSLNPNLLQAQHTTAKLLSQVFILCSDSDCANTYGTIVTLKNIKTIN